MTFTEVRDLGYEYMMLHGVPDDWRFGFNDHKRTLGMCYYKKKRIEVSQELVRSGNTEQIRETILHEIAHALVGPGNRHNDVWRAMAVKVGAKPKACAELEAVPPTGRGAKYKADCPCGIPHFLYRKSKRTSGVLYCRKVGRKGGFLEFKPIG